MTTLKRRRVRLAKELRKALKLKLPESVKLAKQCLRFEEALSPHFTLLRMCGDEGCCTSPGLATPHGRLTSAELRALVEAA
jgi:hypothetical protein